MASTAAAKYPGKPVFFINGILTTPVDITFPTVEPLIQSFEDLKYFISEIREHLREAVKTHNVSTLFKHGLPAAAAFWADEFDAYWQPLLEASEFRQPGFYLDGERDLKYRKLRWAANYFLS